LCLAVYRKCGVVRQNNAEAAEKTGTGSSRKNDSAESEEEDIPPLMRAISHDVEDVEDGRNKYASNSSLDVVSSSNWRNELKVSKI
jgi:hypothetical protein